VTRPGRVTVTLVPFTADLLAAVQPWFTHPEVRQRLGGPQWPAREFALGSGPGGMYRGLRVLRSHSWVAVDAEGVPVAQVGGEVYDRWCRYTEGPAGPVVDRVEPGPAMGLAYVVDPRRWRQGFGTATLRAVIDAPEVADVAVFAAGIEADNLASAGCAAAAGFAPDSAGADWEGIVYHLLRRRVG
jgi:RimJ/RimL family protein N-acetyltransferase